MKEQAGACSTLPQVLPTFRARRLQPDGASVLTGSWDKTARLWDAATGKELRALPNEKMQIAATGRESDRAPYAKRRA